MQILRFLLYCSITLVLSCYAVSAASIFSLSDGDWNDINTWSTQTIPTNQDEVTINAGHHVTLNGNANSKTITVNGELSPSSLSAGHQFHIRSEWILISGSQGRLTIGTEQSPYLGTCQIELIGINDGDMIGLMGDKFIATMNGGVTSLHGTPYQSWTRISTTALAGQMALNLEDPVNWKAGQKIILTTSNRDYKETEVLTIKSVSNNGRTIEVNEQLAYSHYSGTHTYDNGKIGSDAKSWTVNLSSEVGLLSRDIQISGDSNSEIDGFGGHIMTMPSGTITTSGVELFRMGQRFHIGRYPFHWHLAGDVTGEYLRNCSIYESYNRAVVIHGTDKAEVSNNVVYSIAGSAIFLEDAVEQNNVITGNLVASIFVPPHAPSETNFALNTLPGGIDNPLGIVPSDYQAHQDRVQGPAAFWITNANNTINDNVVAGCDGVAYWFGLPEEPTGMSAGTLLSPRLIPILSFTGNVAHSVATGLHFDHSHDAEQEHIINAHYTPEIDGTRIWSELSDFTCYQMDRGWWTRTSVDIAGNITFRDIKLLDCTGPEMIVSSWKGRMFDCLFVGASPNFQEDPDYDGYTAAVSLYDGGYELYDSHFQDFDRAHMSTFAWFGGASDRCNDFFTNCTFDNVIVYNDDLIHRPVRLAGVIRDIDGTLTGIQESSIVPEHPYLIDDINFRKIHPDYIGYQSTLSTYAGKVNIKAIELGDQNSMYSEWDTGHGIHGSVWGGNNQFTVFHKLGRNYLFRWLNQVGGSNELEFKFVQNNDVFDCRFIGSPEQLRLSGITESQSAADLYSKTETGYFWDNEQEILFVRLVANGDPIPDDPVYEAKESVLIETLSGNTRNAITDYPILNQPYRGNVHSVNVINEAEHFDYGGQYLAYLEKGKQAPNPINAISRPGGRYTPKTRDGDAIRHGEVVEIKYSETELSGKASIHNIHKGEYWNYTFRVPKTQEYKLQLKVQSAMQRCGITLSIDDNPLHTQTWNLNGNKYQHVNTNPFTLSEGVHRLTITATQDEFELDWWAVVDTFTGLIDDMAGDNDGDGKDYAEEIALGRDPNLSCDFGSEFNEDGNIEEWWSPIDIEQDEVLGGVYKGNITSNDGYFVSPYLTIEGESVDYIQLKIKAIENGLTELFWNNEEGNFGSIRREAVEYTGNGDWQVLTFDLKENPQWSNHTIYQIRIDPINQVGPFEIDWIRGACGDVINTSADLDGDGKSYIEELSLGRDPFSACDFSAEWNTDGYNENWFGYANLENVTIQNGILSANSTTNDPSFNSPDLEFDGSEIKAVKVRIKANANGQLELFWRDNNGSYSQANRAVAQYSGGGDWQTVIFDLSDTPNWTQNTIYGLRIDPINTQTYFECDWIRGSCIEQVSTTNDNDGDGKTYEEEISLGRNPFSACDFGYEFNDSGNIEGWTSLANVSNTGAINGAFQGFTITNDGSIRSQSLSLDGDEIKVIELRLKANINGVIEFFWKTENSGFNGNKRLVMNYTGNGGYQTIRFKVYEESEWTNEIITQLRIDPSNHSTQFSIDWIRGYCCTNAPNCADVPSYVDNDGDGFENTVDCNDFDELINPGSQEIPNNQIDEDCDGIMVQIDQDNDGFNSEEDCDDLNSEINPGQIEIPNNTIDENCDGFILGTDADLDGYTSDVDCDDTDASINPGQAEIPNNDIDENCDGIIEGFIADEDGDGYLSPLDCDDTNAQINPGALEIPNNEVDENCDGIILIIDEDQDGYNSDEDCDDLDPTINPGQAEIPNNDIDEDCDGIVIIIDIDQDGYNSDEDCDDFNPDISPGSIEIPNNTTDEDCDGVAQMIDEDGDGFNSDIDCDDDDPAINPDATEVPNNSIDENCDGIFEGTDIDEDGFMGDEDCNDLDPAINPNAIEICDNIDNNCDGQIDEGFVLNTYYLDSDGDGYGDPSVSIMGCQEPSNSSLNNMDCDDSNPLINPNAVEIINNEIDENCDGIITQIDNDQDGFNSDEDCDDNDALINPLAIEICDEIDNNCDGMIDEGLYTYLLFEDNDGDGYGNPELSIITCKVLVEGYVENHTDCNDSDEAINPAAEDIPNNGVDENCDGQDFVSAINDVSQLFTDVKFFPNPLTDRLSIKVDSESNYTLKILSIYGETLLSFDFTGEETAFDLSTLPVGIYTAVLSERKSQQFVVEKLIVTQ